MPVLEAILAAFVIVLVVGGLSLVLFLDRSRSRPGFNAVIWWWSLLGLGLLGVTIAWTTSAIS